MEIFRHYEHYINRDNSCFNNNICYLYSCRSLQLFLTMLYKRYANFETSIKAITPEGVEFILSPVGFPVRTLAYAIDKSIQWFILIILYVIFAVFRQAFGIWMFYLLTFIIDWFYHVIFDIFFKGQSPGKRIMGIRVVKSDGSPVDPSSSLLRNLLRFADTFFCLFSIAFISIAASPGFRRIGDWAGGTLVIYSSIAKNSLHNSLKTLLEKYEPLNPARSLSQNEKQVILNFARRYPLLGEARANEIVKLYVPYLKNDDIIFNNSDSAYLMGIARKLSGEI
jgi:uncharacterized RDD family membrane protein YckC